MQDFRNQRAPDSPEALEDYHRNLAMIAGINNRQGNASRAWLDYQKSLEDKAKSTFDMGMKIEEFKAAQENQRQFNAFKEKFLSGAGTGTGGTDGNGESGSMSDIYSMPPQTREALANTTNKAEWDKIFNKYQEDINAERAKRFYNIEWDKPVALGIGNDVRIMTLRAAQSFLSGEKGKQVTSIKDPATGQNLDPNTGKPVPSSSPKTPHPGTKPPANKNDIDPSLVPRARPVYKEGGHVKHFAKGSTTGELAMADIPAQSDSVFADVAPILVADASNATPTIPVTAKRLPQASDFPLAPEQVHKTRDIANTIETTGGQEREKEDQAIIKKLEEGETQARKAKDLVNRYQDYLDKKPYLFGPIKSNPILNAVVPVLEGIPGVKKYSDKPSEHESTGLDLRQALTNAEITNPEDIGDRDNASSLATLLGIAYAKVNFPGRMTNIELQQQQKGKGLNVDDTPTSNQHAINLIKHESDRMIGVAESWRKFKTQEEKLGHRPTWSNFELTDAYDHWNNMETPPEAIGKKNVNPTITTPNGNTVTKVGK